MMKYKFIFKGLDDENLTLAQWNTRVQAFLFSQGYGINMVQVDSNRNTGKIWATRKVRILDNSAKGYMNKIQNLWTQYETKEVEVFYKEKDGLAVNYLPLSKEVLKFFDSLNFDLTASHKLKTGQDITDWWDM